MDEIQKSLATLADHWLPLFGLLTAVGAASMAFAEAVKGFFNLRLLFNRWMVRSWLKNGEAQTACLRTSEFESLTSGSHATGAHAPPSWFAGRVNSKDVLYDQPLEKMMGQIQAAANLALEFPDRYEAIYFFFAGKENPDALAWRNYCAGAGARSPGPKAAGRPSRQPGGDDREIAGARTRVMHVVQRRLDMFQNESQYFWADLNQRVTFLIGAALLGFGLWPAYNVVAVPLAILGGAMAPFAKDVVSGLQQLRGK